MTTRPRMRSPGNLVVGVLALALFAAMAAVFLTAEFDAARGFTGQGSITASIGYAMFNLAGGAYPSEGFLVAFEIIDVVLVAALAAAVLLARREEEFGREAFTDGGRPPEAGEDDRAAGSEGSIDDGDATDDVNAADAAGGDAADGATEDARGGGA